jgi:hypothetical protein
MRHYLVLFVCTMTAGAAACSGRDDAPSSQTEHLDEIREPLSVVEQHGRDVWFKRTFGGEKFFSLVLPAPPFNLQLGLDAVLTSNRNTRFDVYGAINDPDCVQGDATTGFLDRCNDPESAGIVGVRKLPNPSSSGPRMLIGVACAGCHAGLDPSHPPSDPNHPAWADIHPTIGNQYLEIGKIFSAHLSPHDPRHQVFRSWAPGTVDTTAIENDHINNPGTITQFFDLPYRPFYDFTHAGMPIHVHQMGQGGEDSVGCELAALRVFFNIGMCAAECMIGHLANGPGGTQTPIDLAQCRRDCADFRDAEASVGDMCSFMASTRPPRLVEAPLGATYIDASVLHHGKQVFDASCASCHSNGGGLGSHDVLSDDALHVATGFDLLGGEPAGAIGTQRCRALSTNWKAGQIWAPFSSDDYKSRPTGGPGFYRDVPLQAVWATAPFLHNNRLGAFNHDPSVAGRIAAYEDAMDQLLNPTHRDFLRSIVRTTDSVNLPGLPFALPAGVPVNLFASLDPNDPLHNLCPELVENGGHYFGSHLPAADKYALKEWLKTR